MQLYCLRVSRLEEEGTEHIQTLIVGRDSTGVGAFS
jgi:hypothetical protein